MEDDDDKLAFCIAPSLTSPFSFSPITRTSTFPFNLTTSGFLFLSLSFFPLYLFGSQDRLRRCHGNENIKTTSATLTTTTCSWPAISMKESWIC